MDNLALYSQHPTILSVEQLESLVDGAKVSEEASGYSVRWDDVCVRLTHQEAGPELEKHLSGFQSFVRQSAGPAADEMQELIDEIGLTELVIGCAIEPAFDPTNKAKSFLVSLAATYERCMMFYNGAILSPFGEVWFGPAGTEPLADLSELQVRKIALIPFPAMTDDQKRRQKRIGSLLAKYGVPEPMQRSWVDDQSHVTLRSPQEVARRVLALHSVVCIARGRPMDETMDELRNANAEDALTPAELDFLSKPQTSEQERQMMIWKLEDLWCLMWALRHIEKFTWPDQMCDVEGLHALIFETSKDSTAFVEAAQLRSKNSILDAAQLIIQLHSVIRSAMLAGETIPENLSWLKPTNHVAVTECPNVGIVAERHYALNWLRKYMDCDWDDVDTPTIPSAIDYADE